MPAVEQMSHAVCAMAMCVHTLFQAGAPETAAPMEPGAQISFDWIQDVQDIAYLVAALLFIAGIKQLASPRTARRGNAIAGIGMLLAIGATLYLNNWISLEWMFAAALIGSIAGVVLALRMPMTAMPQLVALFNGFGGLASVLVALSEYVRRIHDPLHVIHFDAGLTIGLGILVGGVTFTGSMIAFAKLQGVMPGRPIQWTMQKSMNAVMLAVCIIGSVWIGVNPQEGWWWSVILLVLGLVLGVTLIIPIGGADMPVVVSLLNSYSGIAACATGFIIEPPNKALIVSGALVGASGIILTMIMCKAMNRSLGNVLFGGVGSDDSKGSGGGVRSDGGGQDTRPVRSVDPEELALLLEGVQKVVIAPGYGMAVAQAQHAVRDLYNRLESRGTTVYFGIHPVAGRMPGHMNVLLAEVDIPYDRLLDLDQANAELESAEIAIVIGANDVVNPAARHDRSSPIYGMPILDVDKAQTCIVCKRSMAAGYAGVENDLFHAVNTLMFFGDAKKTIGALNKAIDENT